MSNFWSPGFWSQGFWSQGFWGDSPDVVEPAVVGGAVPALPIRRRNIERDDREVLELLNLWMMNNGRP